MPVIDISDPDIPWNPKKVGHDEFDINKVKFEFRTNRRMRYKKGTKQTPIENWSQDAIENWRVKLGHVSEEVVKIPWLTLHNWYV